MYTNAEPVCYLSQVLQIWDNVEFAKCLLIYSEEDIITIIYPLGAQLIDWMIRELPL